MNNNFKAKKKLNIKRKMFRSNKKKIILIDGHNMIYRCIFGAHKEGLEYCLTQEEIYISWKNNMLINILELIKNNEPDKFIFAIDCKINWRKDIFSEYKAHRKKYRDKCVVDFKEFFPILEEFLEELKTIFTNMYFIECYKCEGDDVISVIAKKESKKNNEILIISTDKDYIQLLTNKNIKLYSPIKKDFITSLNPPMDLEIKVLSGDASDNIPGVKSRCGIKTARKMIDEGLDEHIKEPDEERKLEIKNRLYNLRIEIRNIIQEHPEGLYKKLKKFKTLKKEYVTLFDEKTIKNNYERNKLLIDFTFIPDKYKDEIINTYINYDIKKLKITKVIKFLVKSKCISIYQNLSSYQNGLKKLSNFSVETL